MARNRALFRVIVDGMMSGHVVLVRISEKQRRKNVRQFEAVSQFEFEYYSRPWKNWER